MGRRALVLAQGGGHRYRMGDLGLLAGLAEAGGRPRGGGRCYRRHISLARYGRPDLDAGAARGSLRGAAEGRPPARSQRRLARVPWRGSLIGSLWPEMSAGAERCLTCCSPKPNRAGVGAARCHREQRLPSHSWPDRQLLDHGGRRRDGGGQGFRPRRRCPLPLAVAASCAVPVGLAPIAINGRRFVDGGVRSAANVDLATGCDRVVVLAPVAYAVRRSQRIDAQPCGSGR